MLFVSSWLGGLFKPLCGRIIVICTLSVANINPSGFSCALIDQPFSWSSFIFINLLYRPWRVSGNPSFLGLVRHVYTVLRNF